MDLPFEYNYGNPPLHLSDDSIEKYIKLLDDRKKILRFHLNCQKNPEYGLKIVFQYETKEWHFEFCDRYNYYAEDSNNKCNCFKFIYQEPEKLFDIARYVSKNFNLYTLCKNFKLLDITSENCQIDSIPDLLEECEIEKYFFELYDCLKNHGGRLYVNPSIIPFLEKFKFKPYMFENLLDMWMKNSTDKYKADEAIRKCPHLMALYRDCVKKYSGYLKSGDLVPILHKIDEMKEIDLEIVNVNSGKGRFLSRDEFIKSIQKFNGCKYKILEDIYKSIPTTDNLCYIVSFRINGEDSMAEIPIYNYLTYDDIVDKMKIFECNQRLMKKPKVKLVFINDSIGWHFTFCPNNKKCFRNGDTICNCLKFIHDDLDKLFDILEKVSPYFVRKFGELAENFEYFNIAIENYCSIESIDEYKSNEDFKKLFENIDLGIPKNDINPTTILPLLEKLKVCQETFVGLLEKWMMDDRYKYWVDENVRKYPRLSGFYYEYYRKFCSRCLFVKNLILVLEKMDDSSHIHLKLSFLAVKGLNLFEGNKRKVIDEILQNSSKKEVWGIEELEIDYKLYPLYNIPFYMFAPFDETDRKSMLSKKSGLIDD